MAMSRPLQQSLGEDHTMSKQHLDEKCCIDLMKLCLKQGIETLIHQRLGHTKQKSKQLAKRIISENASARHIMTFAVNGPNELEQSSDHEAFTLIENFAAGLKDLIEDQKFVHLLLSFPIAGGTEFQLDGSSPKMTESTMRLNQYKGLADGHSTIDLNSNAVVVEVLSAVSLYSVLEAFIEKMSCLVQVKSLFVYFNGHGTPKGELMFQDKDDEDSSVLHMNEIVGTIQMFRENHLPHSVADSLQDLHIVFGQCYSYMIDWKAALKCDQIKKKVVWLTFDEPERQKTHNSWTVDGRVVQEELMQFKHQTEDFHSTKILAATEKVLDAERRAHAQELQNVRDEERKKADERLRGITEKADENDRKLLDLQAEMQEQTKACEEQIQKANKKETMLIETLKKTHQEVGRLTEESQRSELEITTGRENFERALEMFEASEERERILEENVGNLEKERHRSFYMTLLAAGYILVLSIIFTYVAD